jgi:predicted nucleotidyltransferase
MGHLEEIKQKLVKLKPELLEKFSVQSIGLFGSVVRDDFSSLSDIDIIVEFNKPIGIEFFELADLIEEKLEKAVDLVSRKGIKPKYFDAIKPEIIYV